MDMVEVFMAGNGRKRRKPWESEKVRAGVCFFGRGCPAAVAADLAGRRTEKKKKSCAGARGLFAATGAGEDDRCPLHRRATYT